MFVNLTKNVKAEIQDPDDLGVTIHAQLFSDGSEIYTDSLLPLGTYSFWDTPALDTGIYSHDLTRMSISDVQKQFINSTLDYTNRSVFDLGSGVSGIQELETNQTINEYTLSAPKDTNITIFMNYTIDKDFFTYTTVNKSANQDSNLLGIYYNNSKFYCVDQISERVYVYDETFTYTSTYHSISQTALPYSLCADESYFYVLDESDDIYQYDSDWNYVGLSKDLTSIDSQMHDIRYFDGYFYALGDYYKQIYKFDSNWNYISGSGTLGSDHLYSFWQVNEEWFVMSNSDNHRIYRYDSDYSDLGYFTYGADYYGAVGGLAFNGSYFWHHGTSGAKFYQHYSHNWFDLDTTIAKNFNYTILNTNYTQNISLSYEYKPELNLNYGNCTFTFASSNLDYYDYSNDLTILTQNITIVLNKEISEADIDLDIYVNYSYTQRRVPTEIDLKVNNEDVSDTSYNSGFVAFSEFHESLEFTSSDENIYFEFNLTSYFTFDIELDIISKTYLRENFKLLSNHSISLTRMTFPDTLDMLKIYLNNIDWGNNTITYLIPSVEMETNQIFWLEVILGEEMYIPLSHVNQTKDTTSVNEESRYLDNESYAFTNGSLHQNGTLGILDSDYSTFNSTNEVGNFSATYGFKYDTIGSDPAGWTVTETGGTVNVISDVGQHKKVLELHDTDGSNGIQAKQTFSSQNSDVTTVEFWFRTDDTTQRWEARLEDSGLSRSAYMYNPGTGQLQFSDGGAWTNVLAINNDNWYHVKIILDFTNSEYDAYIDSVLEASNFGFHQATSDIVDISFGTSTPDNGYYVYVDAIGYSWDPEYEIGDNLNFDEMALNFTSTIQFNNFSLEQVDYINVSYAYKTDAYVLTNVSIYNFTSHEFDVINSTCNNQSFYMNSSIINASYLNESKIMLFKFELLNNTSNFSLYLDLLQVSVFYYSEYAVYHQQNTETPRTDQNSVDFEEHFQANRSYKYWYFENSYDINSISLLHNETSTTISSFQINNSRYYFEEMAYEDDLFIATIDYNPNWVVSHEIQINNGTYSKIKVDYSADFNITNVSIVLDLSSSGCYNENWTLNATQNLYNYKLIIPHINFTSSTQTFYIEGVSVIPYVSISSYESDQNYNAIAIDTEIDFAGFISYPKFTKVFLLNKSSSWSAYNLYYGSQIYAVETVSSTLIQVSGSGFDPAITNSYLHFKVKPFVEVDFSYSETTNIITITINSTMNVDNCEFLYTFKIAQAHSLRIIQGDIFDLDDKELEGYLLFRTERIGTGITTIKIYVDLVSWEEMLVSSIFMFSVVGGFIAAYYYIKHNEEKMAKVKGWFNKKVLEKLERKKKEKEFEKIVLSQTKDGKFTIESEK